MWLNFEEALTAEIGSITGLSGKVFPGFSPGRTAPYAVYLSSQGLRDKTLTNGYLNSKQVGVSLNIVAATYGQFKPLLNAALDKLISFEGRVIGTDGPFIDELTYEQPVELWEDEPKLYRGLIEFEVYYKESE
ncbi:tail completion protein gp17 [Paenibacillus rhizolycopersici]|uniref:tail completion protein gp17 n=1 Tax=Paenibacillus rhizolycopersici TaxID=2780073 RepID=UPI003D2A2ED6